MLSDSLLAIDAATATSVDVTAPSVPGTPVAIYDPVALGVNVNWEPSTDSQSGVESYFVHRNGASVQNVPAFISVTNPDGSTSTEDNSLWFDPDGVVGDEYEIRARDNALNTSSLSASSIAYQVNNIPLEVLMDFADGTLGGRNTTGRVTVVTPSPNRYTGGRGTKSDFAMQVYMDKNQVGYGSSALTRAEISTIYERPPLRTPVWYGYSIFVPSDYAVPNNIGPNGKRLTTWEIITQFHASGAFVGANPTGAVYSYQNNDWNGQTLIRQWDPVSVQILGDDRDSATWIALPSKSYQTNLKRGMAPLQVNRWNDLVFRWVWDWKKLSDGGVGHVQGWLNGTRYLNEPCQNCMNEEGSGGAGETGPFLKIGMYKGWNNATLTPTDSVYASPGTRMFQFGYMRIALESKGANYSTVDPVTNYGARP